jgi:hypothetical protein
MFTVLAPAAPLLAEAEPERLRAPVEVPVKSMTEPVELPVMMSESEELPVSP